MLKKKTIFKIGNIPTKALQSINKINTLFINYSGHEHIAEQKDYHIIQDGFAINAEKNLWTFYCTKCYYDLFSNHAKNENLI